MISQYTILNSLHLLDLSRLFSTFCQTLMMIDDDTYLVIYSILGFDGNHFTEMRLNFNSMNLFALNIDLNKIIQTECR